MKKIAYILATGLILTFASCQTPPDSGDTQTDSTSTPLEITGSVDAYYKYDFAKTPNIGTSFASDQNSVSLGMIDIALKKKTGKTSFVGELSFGPRGQSQSILPQDILETDGGDISFSSFNPSLVLRNLRLRLKCSINI